MKRTVSTDGGNEDAGGYDPDTGTYTARHDWDTEQSLATSIIRAVAAVTNEEPMDIDPLYAVVDPDALETLFESLQDDPQSRGDVSFRFHDRPVTVDSSGLIRIDCHDEDEPASE